MAPSLASIARYSLSALYVISGFAKVQTFNAGVADGMLKEFKGYAKVFPLVSYGYTPEPAMYKMTIGWVEVVCGLLMVFGPLFSKRLSCLVLAAIMAGATYTHYILQVPLGLILFPAFCGVGLLYVYYKLVTTEHDKRD